jgi:osmotically inducible protein OsmC
VKVIYTAEATVTGGRDEGHGRTSDGLLDVQLRVAPELGGPGDGTNPEQLFAVGYASCFGSAMKLVAQRMKVDAGDHTIVSRVMLVPAEERRFKLAVELDITLPSLDDEQAVELVERAHRVCPYSNATRGNIDVGLTVNGRALEATPAQAGASTQPE